MKKKGLGTRRAYDMAFSKKKKKGTVGDHGSHPPPQKKKSKREGPEPLMFETIIKKRRISFKWSGTLENSKTSSVYFDYDTDISKTPRHAANFMLAMVLSEHFAWNSFRISFDELTQKETIFLNKLIELHKRADPYDRANKAPSTVSARRTVQQKNIVDNGLNFVSNGMGKDGVLISNLVAELEGVDKLHCFTVGNQYTTFLNKFQSNKIFNERIKTMKSFYRSINLPEEQQHLIETDYLNGNFGYRVIPWWTMGIPLAYKYGSCNILAGCEISYSKIDRKTRLPIRPNISFITLHAMSQVGPIKFSSPTTPLTNFGVQKLLVERYPDSLKYQRSCMKGLPYCNQCTKCFQIQVYLKALNVNIKELNLVEQPVESHVGVLGRDSCMEILKKIQGESYNERYGMASKIALDYAWNKYELYNILKEHFEFYNDDLGMEYLLPKWRSWIP